MILILGNREHEVTLAGATGAQFDVAADGRAEGHIVRLRVVLLVLGIDELRPVARGVVGDRTDVLQGEVSPIFAGVALDLGGLEVFPSGLLVTSVSLSTAPPRRRRPRLPGKQREHRIRQHRRRPEDPRTVTISKPTLLLSAIGIDDLHVTKTATADLLQGVDRPTSSG